MRATQYFRVLIVAVLAAVPFNLGAQGSSEITSEGYDRQSPEEIERARREIETLFHDAEPGIMSVQDEATVLAQYSYFDPMNEVPTDLLKKALLYFHKNKTKFPNQEYLTIVDFKLRSNKARFFLIHVATGAVEKFHTTHGLNSDKNKNGYAESFGNVINSGKSSLGFARVSEIYVGRFGRSIRLDGLSSTNSNIRARAVVFHGWDQAYEADIIQGLSWGCITLDYKVKDNVLDRIANGSLMYVGVSAKKK